MNIVRYFLNYAIFRELCDRMRFEVEIVRERWLMLSEVYEKLIVFGGLIEEFFFDFGVLSS